jgi:general secretion pathway protein G
MASDPDVPGESRLPYYVIGAVVALLLATIVVPALLQTRPECLPVRADFDIRIMAATVEPYAAMKGRLPRSFEDLLRPGTEGRRYLMSEVVPCDRWGRPYLYWTNADGTFEIVTYGEDGRPGGEGAEADVTLSMLQRR